MGTLMEPTFQQEESPSDNSPCQSNGSTVIPNGVLIDKHFVCYKIFLFANDQPNNQVVLTW